MFNKKTSFILVAFLLLFVVASCGEDVPYYSVTYISEGSVVYTDSVAENKTARNYTSLTRTGYNLDCWLLDGQKYNFSNPVTSDLTLTASWKKKTAQVKYVSYAPLAYGSSVPTDNTVYEYGDAVTVSTTTLESSNAGSFLGWSTSLFSDTIDSFNIEENTTLYAVWEYNVISHSCTVTSKFLDELTLTTTINFDPQMFFRKKDLAYDNKTFHADIAKFSILLATDSFISSKVVIDDIESNSKDLTNSTSIYQALGFSDVQEKYTAVDDAKDLNDFAGYIISHCDYSSINTSLIIVTIKGPDNTYEQWHSSCDFGADIASYYETAGIEPSTNTNWSNKNLHKGYDVTAQRLKKEVDQYIKDYVPSENQKVMLITGQSRGGAIANVMGAAYEKDTSVTTYTYVFGCPTVSADTQEVLSGAKTVFNIINTDDAIAYAPTFFGIYGTVLKCDNFNNFKASYSSRVYKGKTTTTYKELKLQDQNSNLLNAFGNIATTREEMYTFETVSTPITMSTDDFESLEDLGVTKYLKYTKGSKEVTISAVMPAVAYYLIPVLATNITDLDVNKVMPIITLVASLNNAGMTKYMDIIECITGDFDTYTTEDFFVIIGYLALKNYDALLDSLHGVNNPYGLGYAHDPISYIVLTDLIAEQ